MEKVILDTNILIEILKGNSKIIHYLENSPFSLCISSVSVMELYYGAFNKQELKKLQKFIELFYVMDINENISKLSTHLIFSYAKSHNLAIPDSLIAATALTSNYKLFTLNIKDFRFIDGLELLK